MRKIDRILFAATKADHVHHGDHDRLARLLGQLSRFSPQRASTTLPQPIPSIRR